MYPLILDQPATLHVRLDAWAHRRTYRIRLTEETRLNYRFQALEDIPVGTRWLRAGKFGRVPKSAVTPDVPVERRVSRHSESDTTKRGFTDDQ